MWRKKVRDVYSSLQELEGFSETFSIAERVGYKDAATLWDDNPFLIGSTDPRDLRRCMRRPIADMIQIMREYETHPENVPEITSFLSSALSEIYGEALVPYFSDEFTQKFCTNPKDFQMLCNILRFEEVADEAYAAEAEAFTRFFTNEPLTADGLARTAYHSKPFVK